MTLGIRRAVELSSASVSAADAGGGPVTADGHVSYTVRNLARGDAGVDFRVLEFAPRAFRTLRQLYGWSEADYVDEWELEAHQKEGQQGAGRSGALFTKSRNKKLMCKTIFGHEVNTLLSVLPQYVEHVRLNRDTLVMPLLGLYRLGEGQVATGSDVVYALVFSNLTYCGPEISVEMGDVYDLKGRRVKTRRFHDENGATEEKGVRKDKHLERLFYVGELQPVFVKQIAVDVAFLNTSNLIDYSLLVALGTCAVPDCEECAAPPQAGPQVSLFRSCHGGFRAGREILYIGIIDCLTFFSTAKKMANTFKRILWEQDQLSTVEQNFYAHRFLSYVNSIFPPGPEPHFAPFVPNRAVSTRRMFDMDVLTDGYTTLIGETLGTNAPVDIDRVVAANFEEQARYTGRKFIRMDRQEELTYVITEHAPGIFASLRAKFGVANEQLQASWSGLSELQVRATLEVELMENVQVVTVASRDRQFYMQRIQAGHMRDFRAFLPDYFQHMHRTHSALQRVVGLFTFRLGRTDVHVLVSENDFPLQDSVRWCEMFTLRGAIPRKTDLATASTDDVTDCGVTASKEDLARLAADYRCQEAERRLCGIPLRLSDIDIQFRRFQLVLTEADQALFAQFQATIALDMQLLAANNLTGFGLQFSLAEALTPEAADRYFNYVESHGDVALPRSEDSSCAAARASSVCPPSNISQATEGTPVLAFGRVTTIWKRYGKRDTLSSLIRGQAQTIVDPATYCSRLRNLLGELFLVAPATK